MSRSWWKSLVNPRDPDGFWRLVGVGVACAVLSISSIAVNWVHPHALLRIFAFEIAAVPTWLVLWRAVR